jgi:hypothetical protein
MMKAPWSDRAIQIALAGVASPAPPADQLAAPLIEWLKVKAP